MNRSVDPALPAAAAPRLEMQGITKHFGPTVALEGVDLRVEAGEVHALVGENGAGKSTLMKILSGALQADQGAMRIEGVPYRPGNPLEGRRAGVSMVYQELSLAPHLSIAENILLGVEPGLGPLVDWNRMIQRAEAAMAELGLSHLSPRTPVFRVSTAEQQLVELARAVAVGCRVLVLDEPTSSLAQKDVARLFDLVRSLKKQGHAIIYISHFLEEVREISDCFSVLRDGKPAGGGKSREVTSGAIAALMVGRNVEELYPRSPRKQGEVILEAEDLAGPGLPVLASFRLHRGEILGVSGLIGAGRTALIRSLFGLAPIRRGTVRVGVVEGPALPWQRWKQGTGMVSEDRKGEGLAIGLSIADNLMLTSFRRSGRFGLISPSRQHQESRRWIERLSIRCRGPAQSVADLSGGNQQKIALARLLYEDVDVLLLDEPTRGIDVGSKAEIYRLIDELVSGNPAQGRRPKGVLMVSSHLPELLGICDRIVVMRKGVLLPAQPAAVRSEHEIMLEATGADSPSEEFGTGA